jgi:hypothetical protein
VAPHPSDDDLAAHAQRRLPPAALLAVDAHLRACASCRARLPRTGASARRLLSAESITHLDDDVAASLVDGTLDGVDREIADAHLEDCAICRAEVASLRGAAGELRPAHTYAPARRLAAGSHVSSFAWLAAAAAVVLVAVFGSRSLRPAPPRVVSQESPAPRVSLADGPRPVTLDDAGRLQGLEDFDPGVRQRVADMLAGGRLEAATPKGLAGERQQLMGSPAPTRGFAVVAPSGVVVESTQPTLRWTPLPDGWTYDVLVLDDRLAVQARGVRLSVPEWTPPRPLARGVTYTWQVAASRKGERRLAPAPPEPEARFRVMDTAAAEAVAAARGRSHLVLAFLYADAGAAAEARAQIRMLEDQNPGSEMARRLAASLEAYPPSPTSTNPAQ